MHTPPQSAYSGLWTGTRTRRSRRGWCAWLLIWNWQSLRVRARLQRGWDSSSDSGWKGQLWPASEARWLWCWRVKWFWGFPGQQQRQEQKRRVTSYAKCAKRRYIKINSQPERQGRPEGETPSPFGMCEFALGASGRFTTRRPRSDPLAAPAA